MVACPAPLALLSRDFLTGVPLLQEAMYRRDRSCVTQTQIEMPNYPYQHILSSCQTGFAQTQSVVAFPAVHRALVCSKRIEQVLGCPKI